MDSSLVVNWLNGRRKINNHQGRAEVQKTRICWRTTDIRQMADHLDLFQHIYRGWNEKAHRLTHEQGANWISFMMLEGSKLEAVRAFFNVGVSKKEDCKVIHKVGSAL